jgi:hypothetical protein
MCWPSSGGRRAICVAAFQLALLGRGQPDPPTQPGQPLRHGRLQPHRLRPRKQTLKRTLYGTTRSGSLLKQMIPIKTDQWDVTKRTLVGGERYESLEAVAALNTL